MLPCQHLSVTHAISAKAATTRGPPTSRQETKGQAVHRAAGTHVGGSLVPWCTCDTAPPKAPHTEGADLTACGLCPPTSAPATSAQPSLTEPQTEKPSAVAIWERLPSLAERRVTCHLAPCSPRKSAQARGQAGWPGAPPSGPSLPGAPGTESPLGRCEGDLHRVTWEPTLNLIK